MQKLIDIQKKLKAPKNQTNSFGGYKYRSCEDILEAVKPLLAEAKLLLTITDEIVEVGGRVYVKAVATIWDGAVKHEVSAFARESEAKKGMDDSQITGSASSYARKYALNGLFLIDDTKDADTMDNRKSSDDDRVLKGRKTIEDLIYKSAIDTELMPIALRDMSSIHSADVLVGVYNRLKTFVAEPMARQQWNDLMAEIGVV